MPIYEYQCEKCGHQFEREQRIVDDPIKKCPACKSSKAKRLISLTSFVLKGGGWYKDLYSSAGAAKKSDASGDSASKDSKDSKETKSEPKSGAGKDAKGDAKKGKKSAA